MVLQRVEVEELLARGEVDAFQLSARARPDERGFAAALREPAAEGDVEEPQPRVLLQTRALVGQVPRVAAPFLDRHIADVRALADEDLRRTAPVTRALLLLADVLVEVVEARAAAGDDHGMGQHSGAALMRQVLAQDRLLDHDAVRHIEEVAAGEERGVQG